MIVLGFDTATTGCSAAVWAEGRVVAANAETMVRGQAERLVPMIEATLKDAGLGYDRLDRIAVTVGPGAFTGVRIALAVARGLALATGAGLVGITTFEAVAAAVDPQERAGRRLVAAVDSRRIEPYLAVIGDDGRAGAPAMLAPAAIAAWLPAGPLLLAGDGAPLLAASLGARSDVCFAAAPGLPDARVIAALGATRPIGPAPAPFYVRPPDVTIAARARA